jgi:3-oxoacyl-(acyl-carrier-protein) synthase
VVGTGMMTVSFDELASVQREAAPEGELDAAKVLAEATSNDPMAFCRSQSTAGVSLLMRRFGIAGYASSVHTACASGGQAIGTAMRVIRRGAADRVLAGGFDSMVSPVGLAGFCLLSAVSTDNDAPERASRPFDATRNGFLLGEGAGFVVLEEWQSAVRRGARIYAELAGDGNSLSSYRITDSHPSGDGPIQAMQRALRDAGAAAADVDYLNAHGTSTPMNDRSEAAAAKVVFGDRVSSVAVSSTKSVMGHLIAAAGAVEAVVCAMAIRESTLPVNANLRDIDPDCAHLDIVRGVPRSQRVRVALSNSLGFGGSNSCLAFRHPEETAAIVAREGGR